MKRRPRRRATPKEIRAGGGTGWREEGRVADWALKREREKERWRVMQMALVILAAGMGSRYGGLKQMEGFGPQGETLLEYSLYDARLAGFERVVCVIRRDMEDLFREKVLARFPAGWDTRLVFQDTVLADGRGAGRSKPWGTAHALRCGLEAVEGPFLVMNADDFYGRKAFAQAAGFLRGPGRAGTDYGLIAYRVDRTLSPAGQVSRGVCQVSPEGWLEGIRETHRLEWKTEGIQFTDTTDGRTYSLARDTPVSMNLLAFNPTLGPAVEAGWDEFLAGKGNDPKAEFGIPDALQRVLQSGAGRIRVLPTEETWMGVTHPDDRPHVEAGLRERVGRGEYPSPLAP